MNGLNDKDGEITMADDKMIIKKHSAMIQTNVKELTLTQRKLINYLILIAQKTGKKELYKTTIANIKESCNIGKTENIDLKEQLKKLSDIKIEFNYVNKDKNEVWQIISLLASAEVIQNTGLVEFEFSVKLLDKVLNPSIYAPLSISLISGLKSSYSIVLYEFLRDYVGSPFVPKLLIEEFKNLMGIKDIEYSLFNNFKNRVLDIAVKEVNEKTDIRCEYLLIKEHGNRYSHIQFTVTKQDFQLMLGYNPTIKEDEYEPAENKPKNLPQEIIAVIPEKYRVRAIIELINKHLYKGTEYIVSNIKYTTKNAPEKFGAYLNQAFETDYACYDREIEAKIKVKTERVVKQKVEAEKKVISDRIKTEKKLEIIRQLSGKELEKLRKRAITTIKKESPGNEFALSDSLVEMKMADLHVADHEIEEYSSNDQD